MSCHVLSLSFHFHSSWEFMDLSRTEWLFLAGLLAAVGPRQMERSHMGGKTLGGLWDTRTPIIMIAWPERDVWSSETAEKVKELTGDEFLWKRLGSSHTPDKRWSGAWRFAYLCEMLWMPVPALCEPSVSFGPRKGYWRVPSMCPLCEDRLCSIVCYAAGTASIQRRDIGGR